MPEHPDREATGTIAGGGVSGALVTIGLYILKERWQITFPPEIVSAITVIVVSIGGWLGPKLQF